MSTRIRILTPTLAGLGAALAFAACGRDSGSTGSSLIAPNALGSELELAGSPAPARPFNGANFGNGASNPFFPLTPGIRYSYRTETADGLETNDVDVTSDTKEILGVVTTVIHDVVYLDGSVIEDTYDWYAADDEGNVWYFGEDTKTYDHGTLVTTQGSWEAGQNGASPGIIMLADPQKGDRYQQENSPGVVEDQAKVMALDETVTVPFGTFTNCLKTMDWTPLEPGVRELKYYAPGVGLVLEVSHKGGKERVELTGFNGP